MKPGEIIVDSFAGGGGASLGIQWALGQSPDIAINHDKEAIALHAANHPDSLHLAEDVWKVDPVEACAGRPVGLMWLSPDCKHFSKAKGGKPVDKRIRGLAWVATRWAAAVKPRVIVLENVEEFRTWGPVLANGNPCPVRRGQTFKAFVRKLERLGYKVEWRELRACDFGGRGELAHNGAHLHEQSYAIARGVRPLALVGQCEADAGIRSRVLAHLSTHCDAGAVPFVCEREDGTAEYGYAAAQWAIDLYRWTVNEKADNTLPLNQRHRIIGLLLGYSAAAISDFETAAFDASTSGSSA